MTISERKILSQEPIIWTGDLSDDCLANWAGLMLRAEWMDDFDWWWAVYDMQNNAETIDCSNEYDMKCINGELARANAEKVAKKFIQSIT